MYMTELTHTIVNNSHLHARWLNTFSFLEYIGWRKIVKSQDATTLTLQTLLHGVEEARHALALKRLCLKIGGASFDNYQPINLLCGEEAEEYFQSVDQECATALASEFPANQCARLTYLYVTWLVELRALQVYRPYSEALAMAGHSFSLGALLSEEDRHLQEVESELKTADSAFDLRSVALREMEALRFQTLFQAIVDEIQN